ncbi:unnamed protein product [Cylicostephanus goldi]|uniref:Uncharacterized protein n=1 Tax=Cylicostephanus goldi TaxID=71465 RepID=A0A3P7Q626_CYLGO|nr:unnamed protein product [Cylicostephanus goldi]
MLGANSGSQTDTESSNRMNTGSPLDTESSHMEAPNTENEINHENEQTNMLTAAPDSMLTPSPDSQTGGDVETYQTRNETVPEQPPLDVDLQRPHLKTTDQ